MVSFDELNFNHLLIIAFIGLTIILTLSCITIFNTNEPVKENPTTTTILKNIINLTNNSITQKINDTKIIIIYKNVTVINVINETRINVINETIEYKLNISSVQRDLILNLKPDVCHTVGCSDGFDKCKRETLDILEWKKPKFREAWSSGYKYLFMNTSKKDDLIQFKLLNDSFSEYFHLNTSFWYVNHPINESVYLNIYDNISEYNVTLNKSDLLYNLVDKEIIIIRKR